MSLTQILIAIAVVLILLNMVLLRWPSLRAMYLMNKIHGLSGIPILGSIFVLMMAKPEDILGLFEKFMKKYPRLTSFYVAGVNYVLMQEPEDVQIVLASTDHIDKGFEYLTLVPWLNEGLLLSTGSKWHLRRKLLTPAFHFRILEDSLSSMNKKVDLLVENLTKTCGRTIKVEQWVTRCTLDIIGESAMGLDLKAQQAEGNAYVQSVTGTKDSMIQRILSFWQLKDWTFKLSQNGKIFFRHLSVLHNFTDKVIRDRKATYTEAAFQTEDDVGRKKRRAFLDCLLETQRTEPSSLSDLDIREEVDTFMFEGHDTTSIALTFALWLLGTHTEQQDMVYAEIKDVLGDEDREVTMSEVNNLCYLEKFIKETLRLYPSVPYISRNLTQDCVLDDGTLIPASVNVTILPFFLHRNERFFPDPEKFDPERFSEENSVGRHPFVYIPFSAGPRNCIGQKFAMLEMKLTLCKILQKLKVNAVTRKDEFTVLPYIIISPTIPLKVIFTQR